METNGQLFMRHMETIETVIASVISRFNIPGLDRDDLKQEARAKILKALESWDSAKGKLAPYIARVTANEMGEMIRVARARKRQPRGQIELGNGETMDVFVSPSKLWDLPDQRQMTPEAQVARAERLYILKGVIKSIRVSLQSKDKMVMDSWIKPPDYRINKVSKASVARSLGLSEAQVYWAMKRIKKALMVTVQRQKIEGGIQYLMSGG